MFFATVPPQWCFLRQWSVYFATVAGDNSNAIGSQESRGGGKGVKEDEESRRRRRVKEPSRGLMAERLEKNATVDKLILGENSEN